VSDFEYTPDQQAAINSQSSMVITACPGSGKTTVISQKIRNNVEQLPYYKGVIAITFTIKASKELKTRCKIENCDTKASFFGTIDNFCLSELIHPFWGSVICNAKSELTCIKYAELPENVLGQLVTIPLLHIEPHEVTYEELHNDFLTLYNCGFILLEYLGVIANFVVLNSLACRRYLLARYTHVYIDEYQDSSELQHTLFLSLLDLGLIGVAVGDVQQSIYAWRNSDPVYLSQLTEKSEIFEHHIVNINHRCHPSITNYANRLFDSQSTMLETDEVRVFRRIYDGSIVEISAKLNESIANAMRTGKASSYSKIAVLVRNNISLEYLSNELTVPHRIFDEDKLANKSTDACNIFTQLLRFRFDETYRVNDVVEYLISTVLKAKYDLSYIRKKIKLISGKNYEELSSVIIDSTESILQTEISAFDKTLIESICLDDKALKHYQLMDENEVQVMTLHKSKGLEFEIVFHLDLYDWVHPKRKFVEGCYDVVYDDWQQELNLHFVGITRASEYCMLVSSTNRINSKHEMKNANPSQFFEIPGLEDLYK
jgi:DNA helicase-2/ATP-dependent DNA helicase PcrA